MPWRHCTRANHCGTATSGPHSYSSSGSGTNGSCSSDQAQPGTNHTDVHHSGPSRWGKSIFN